MTALFDPFTLRGITLRNRIVIPPMVMYRAGHDGKANDWHLAHYGRLAMGGASMVFVESTQIDPRGRVGYADLGLWSDEQIGPLRRISDFIKSQDCVPAIQLSHTGRKGGIRRPWDGYTVLDEEDARLRNEPPWPVIGPSAVPYTKGAQVPWELRVDELPQVISLWAAAARRAFEAGFEMLEIHAAHGYLLHQFLSPIANYRTDQYGGDLTGRMRFPLEVVEAVRAAWPQGMALLVRVSSVDDGVDEGWTLEDTVVFSREMKARGVDAIDCSSGGIGGSPTNSNRLARGPGFQVPFAERVRREVEIPTVGVGLITTPEFAAEIVDTGRADLVAIGREALIDPNWPNSARTHMQPERGFADWPPESGWWLDKRSASLRAGR